jgi:hypothetical protein
MCLFIHAEFYGIREAFANYWKERKVTRDGGSIAWGIAKQPGDH